MFESFVTNHTSWNSTFFKKFFCSLILLGTILNYFCKKKMNFQALKFYVKSILMNIPQCGNFMIFLSFRFYVKSILTFLDVQKKQFLHILRLWILIFMHFCNFWRLKFTKWTKFTAPKMAKTAFFSLLESTKLISPKIWVMEKSWNFHTVCSYLEVGSYHSRELWCHPEKSLTNFSSGWRTRDEWYRHVGRNLVWREFCNHRWDNWNIEVRKWTGLPMDFWTYHWPFWNKSKIYLSIAVK